jgi:two-component system CheB/CheR fusion protein
LKAREADLTILNQRLDSAMQHGNIAWWEWDVVSGEVAFDPKKATMLGYTVEEFPTNVYRVCDLIHPEDYESTMAAMRLHLEGKTDLWECTYRIRRKDETYAWYYDRGRVTQKNGAGKPQLAIGAVVDVSRIRALEMQIKDYSDDALHVMRKTGKREKTP